MLRLVLLLLVVFFLLLVLRGLRLLWVSLVAPHTRVPAPPPAVEGEMVRDPVCGTWIDRSLALAGRRGQDWIPVCSEKCRKRLETP